MVTVHFGIRTSLLPTPHCDHMCEFISLQFIFHNLYTKPVLFRFDSLFGNTPSVVSTILIFLLLVKFFIVIVIVLNWLLLQFVLFLHVAYTWTLFLFYYSKTFLPSILPFVVLHSFIPSSVNLPLVINLRAVATFIIKLTYVTTSVLNV